MSNRLLDHIREREAAKRPPEPVVTVTVNVQARTRKPKAPDIDIASTDPIIEPVEYEPVEASEEDGS